MNLINTLLHAGHGHDHGAEGFTHWITEPDHLVVLIGAALLVVGAAVFFAKKRKAAKVRI